MSERTKRDPRHHAFLDAVGEDIRAVRESVDGIPQEAVAEVLDWSGRDPVSKVERGKTNLSLYDYLRLMDFYRELAPDHPAVALSDYFKLKGRNRLRVVTR